MALTLDSTLQTRMDGIERQPTIEILSGSFTSSIPYEGNSFGIAGSSIYRPHLMSLASGRLAQFYIDSDKKLKYMYTDEDRTQWTLYNLSAIASSVEYVCGTELADGNIGFVLITAHLNDWKLQCGVISPTGEVVTALSVIEDLNNAYDWASPYVVQLASGDYYLAYIREDPDTAWTIYARTASAWGTWSAAGDITPSGVNTSREIDNTSLFETAEGDLFLLFDHVTSIQDDVTIKNIFSSISIDDGTTWSAATARTSYTAFGSNGLDPIMVQKSNGTAWLIFYENVRVLHMDDTASGFLESCAYGMGVKDIHCDSANGKIYVTYGNSHVVTKSVCGIAVVDIATWSIDKVYYNSSTPTLNQIFVDNHVWNNEMIHGDGKYLAVGINVSTEHKVISVINHTEDSITTYVIDDVGFSEITDGLPGYNLPRNVEHNSEPLYGGIGITIQCLRIDESRDRLYLGWSGGYYRQYMMFSYIGLTEAPDGEGMYNMTWVTNETSGISIPNDNRVWYENGWQFEIDKDRHYFVAYSSAGGLSYSWNGGMAVLAEDASGAIVKSYTAIENPTVPRWGPARAILYNGALYGTIDYCSTSPHTDQRGLVKIDYLTDVITYYRPSFATVDQYWFYDFALDEENERIYCACQWGIARFDINTGAWTLFNDDTLPGFVRSGESNTLGFVSFDEVNRNVIGGAWSDYVVNYLTGINMFNENGAYNQLQYITADKAASWSWNNQLDLSYYSTEMQPSAIIDIDNYLWTTWNHQDYENNQSILYWGNDLGDIDVTDDIADSVSLNWRIKKVNSLNFALARGHLYDPQNLLSSFNMVGQKGRKIHVRIGEKIGEYTYWVNQGTYLVDTVSMGYARGKHPALSLNCTGKASLWQQQRISVSELYSGQMPDTIIKDIIDTHTEWKTTDYDLPVFEDEHSIYYQWLDKTIWEMIEELCDHFFYAIYEDMDGIFTCRQVSLTQSVDHEYTDQLQLLDFSPDDNYSDFTNRVRVIGESNDYTEVLHGEELITSMGGTVGWWVKKDTETIYYGDDKSRKCRNPRLEIIHSPKEYGFLLDMLSTGDGGIEISHVDIYEKYIIVEIKVKDLTSALAGSISAMLLLGWAAIGCFESCGPFITAIAVATSLVMYILAAMAQYQYEVWARPVGSVKSTIQYETNDVEFQQKLNGEIVTEEMTDALCDTITECRRVAEGNMEMIKAQRNRVGFRKITHLQDELLDKLKVYHPYSGEAMELLIVGLKRTYTKGKGVFDNIAAWRYKS